MEIIARLANLPGALPGACAQGLIWGIMAIGVYLTYRILDVADLTVDGSFGTGGAVCVMCLLSGMNVWLALLVAVLAGLAGRPCHRPAAHLYGHPRHSGRHPDSAGAVLHQPEDHGQGQPGHQRGQVRPAHLPALGQGICPAQPHHHDHSGHGGGHRRAVLVLRHRAGLRHPCHRFQPRHVPCTGHQHQLQHRAGSGRVQRHWWPCLVLC